MRLAVDRCTVFSLSYRRDIVIYTLVRRGTRNVDRKRSHRRRVKLTVFLPQGSGTNTNSRRGFFFSSLHFFSSFFINFHYYYNYYYSNIATRSVRIKSDKTASPKTFGESALIARKRLETVSEEKHYARSVIARIDGGPIGYRSACVRRVETRGTTMVLFASYHAYTVILTSPPKWYTAPGRRRNVSRATRAARAVTAAAVTSINPNNII